MLTTPFTVGLIGYGEAASAFTAGWSQADAKNPSVAPKTTDTISAIYAFDIKTNDNYGKTITDQKWNDYKKNSVHGCKNIEVLLDNCHVIFSLVTADQAISAAQALCAFNLSGVTYFDCNSCSPSSKKTSSALITKAGGLYIDVAVMSPVYPALHQTPLLISGEDAQAGSEILKSLGMNISIAGDKVGEASSIKMIRSIMVKGMEALTAECVLAASLAGVDEQVLSSLQHTFPSTDWKEKSFYNLERMFVHGNRRSAEMNEVAKTLEELGIDNSMTLAAAKWQSAIGKIGQLNNSNNSLLNEKNYAVISKNILSKIK